MTNQQLAHFIELFNNNSHKWMQRSNTNASTVTNDPMSAAECYGRGATWAQAANTLEALLNEDELDAAERAANQASVHSANRGG